MSASPDGGAVAAPPSGRRRLGADVAVVLPAVLAHPSLWWTGLAAVRRLARTGWWRRPPFLPLPGEAYWEFRQVTAFGGPGHASGRASGRASALDRSDVVAYLQWCRRTRPRRG